MSIRKFLYIYVLACVLPIVMLSGFLAYDRIQKIEKEADGDARARLANVALTVEGQVQAKIRALQSLAESRFLSEPHQLEKAYQQSQGFIKHIGGHIVLSGTDMQMLYNTRLPYGSSLPKLPRPKGHAAAPTSLKTGKPDVGDVFFGPIAKKNLVAIVTPVLRDGIAKFLLISILDADSFQDLLEKLAISPKWSVAIFDSTEQLVAARFANGLHALPPSSGVRPGRYLVKLSSTPWTLVLETAPSEFYRATYEQIVRLSLLLFGALLMALIAALVAAQRLTKSVRSLAEPEIPSENVMRIAEIENVREKLVEANKAKAIARKELTASEERFRLSVREAPVPVIVHSEDGEVLALSRAWSEISGYDINDIPTIAAWTEKAYGDSKEVVREVIDALYGLDRRKDEGNFIVQCANGATRTWRFSSAPLGRLKDGRRAVISVASDITELLERNSEVRRLAQIVEQSPVTVLMTDPEGVIEYVNPAFTRISGYGLEDVAGQTPLILSPADTSDDSYENLWTAIMSGKPWAGILRNKKKDGSFYWASTTVTPIMDDSKIVGFIGFGEDITERIENETQLLQIQKMDALGNMASGIAHDINNMLMPIVGLSEVILNDLEKGSKQAERFEKVLDAALRARDMLRPLVNFARKSVPKKENVDIVEAVRRAVEVIRPAMPSTMQIEMDLPASLGSVLLDESAFSSVLMNLASNARDAFKGGTGRLDISIKSFVADNQACHKTPVLLLGKAYAIVTVRDNGSGMDHKTVQRIFDPFFTTKDVGKGTGLGMAMVYDIITKHDGCITVISEPGRGSIFEVYLPLQESGSG